MTTTTTTTTGTTMITVATPTIIMVPEAKMGVEGTMATVEMTMGTVTVTMTIPTVIKKRELVKSSDAIFLIAVQEKILKLAKNL